MIKRLALAGAVGGLFAVAACTPQEAEMWRDWHAQDPQAAEAFAADLASGNNNNSNNDDDDNGGGGGSSGGGGGEPAQGVWDRIAECESGGNWSINTGNGYYGGLQFSLSSWRAVGGTGYPHEHSRAEQIRRAEMLLDAQGWDAWPTCSSRLGLR